MPAPYNNDPVVSVTDDTRAPAVKGVSSTLEGIGVYGESQEAEGVRGVGHNGAGVSGTSDKWIGVYGESTSGIGVQGKGRLLAGLFQGDVEVTGDIRLAQADCAEEFPIGVDLSVGPGTVMVVADDGLLRPSTNPYDKRVAGVVSGAGECRPAIVLGRQQADALRQPIALLGKVY